jgi:hypothetical protein
MLLELTEPPRRDTSQYRAFKRQIRRERPICEHCNRAKSVVIAHIRQPLFGGGLMDATNVLALCVQCDADYTRSNPPLRRRKQQRF